ncbi:MAG: glutathione S-transferase family protein [bacterium]
MKLHWSPRSPFVRKVMILAHETGLDDRIERVRSVVGQIVLNADVMRDNPLNKIPTLVLEDGTVIYDSPVVCEYLDGLHGGAKMFPADPADPAARVTALRWQALGDGLLDLLLLWRNELGRPAERQFEPVLEAFKAKTQAVLDSLEGEAQSLAGRPFGIGHISIGCALSYLDFRLAELNWRDGRPTLAQWHEGFSDRASVRAAPIVDDA